MVSFLTAALIPTVVAVAVQVGMRISGNGNGEIMAAHTGTSLILGLIYAFSAYWKGLKLDAVLILGFNIALVFGLGALMIYHPVPATVVLIVFIAGIVIVGRLSHLDSRHPSNARRVSFKYSGGVTSVPAAGRTKRDVDADIKRIRRFDKKRK